MTRKHYQRKPRTSDHSRHPVEVVKPGINSLDPKVREVALKLARGDASRIEVESPQRALVR